MHVKVTHNFAFWETALSQTPLQQHPYWKHKPLSENDTVDSLDMERLTIRAVRPGQKFFFPHWKLSDMHQSKQTSMSCVETKTGKRMLAGRNEKDTDFMQQERATDLQLHSTSKVSTQWFIKGAALGIISNYVCRILSAGRAACAKQRIIAMAKHNDANCAANQKLGQRKLRLIINQNLCFESFPSGPLAFCCCSVFYSGM